MPGATQHRYNAESREFGWLKKNSETTFTGADFAAASE